MFYPEPDIPIRHMVSNKVNWESGLATEHKFTWCRSNVVMSCAIVYGYEGLSNTCDSVLSSSKRVLLILSTGLLGRSALLVLYLGAHGTGECARLGPLGEILGGLLRSGSVSIRFLGTGNDLICSPKQNLSSEGPLSVLSHAL